MLSRIIEEDIKSVTFKGKVIVLFGARQIGKTTIIKKIFSEHEEVLWLNGDDLETRTLFSEITTGMLKSVIGNHKVVVIDEAQRIKNIGVTAKIIADQMPTVQLVISGSSAFELANEIKEPLTGRKYEYQLFPFSFEELVAETNLLKEKALLPQRLVYGSYPEVVTHRGEEKRILNLLSDSYLYKDILMWESVKKPEKLIKLMQALAHQVGSEVSYNELGRLIGLDTKTVEHYINLLKKTFVIFSLGAFSRNLRKELKTKQKIYFYDNGIRNALIANFTPFELRTDKGMLWENYIISERIKYASYHHIWQNTYFWRTQDQQEIDWIEERDGVLHTYEFKLNPKKKARLSKTFQKAYPEHTFQVINQDNFMEFILP